MALAHVGQALEIVAEVLAHGDAKHGLAQWLRSGRDPDTNLWDHISGCERHLGRVRNGEVFDKDSQILGLGHVAARALMALTFQIQIEQNKATRVCGNGDFKSGVICDLIEGHDGSHYSLITDEEWETPTNPLNLDVKGGGGRL